MLRLGQLPRGLRRGAACGGAGVPRPRLAGGRASAPHADADHRDALDVLEVPAAIGRRDLRAAARGRHRRPGRRDPHRLVVVPGHPRRGAARRAAGGQDVVLHAGGAAVLAPPSQVPGRLGALARAARGVRLRSVTGGPDLPRRVALRVDDDERSGRPAARRCGRRRMRSEEPRPASATARAAAPVEARRGTRDAAGATPRGHFPLVAQPHRLRGRGRWIYHRPRPVPTNDGAFGSRMPSAGWGQTPGRRHCPRPVPRHLAAWSGRPHRACARRSGRRVFGDAGTMGS